MDNHSKPEPEEQQQQQMQAANGDSQPTGPRVSFMKATYEWLLDLPCEQTRTSRPNRVISSPTFSPKHEDGIKWRLRLYPDETPLPGREGADHLTLQVVLESSNASELQAYCRCSLVNLLGRETKSRTSILLVVPDGPRSVEFPSFMRDCLRDSNGYAIYADVSILCKIYAFGREGTQAVPNGPAGPTPDERLSRDFSSLMDDDKLTDVTLVAGNRELRAHKAILAARSPVFAKMFEHEMREKRQNIVRINDVEPRVLELMLRYIYSARLDDVQKNNAVQLMVAADKYQLDELKEACEESILAGLTVSNAVATLVLADRHSADKLKFKTIEFMNAHASQVVETSAFRQLNKAQAYLVMEAYCVLAAALKRNGAQLGNGGSAVGTGGATSTKPSKRPRRSRRCTARVKYC